MDDKFSDIKYYCNLAFDNLSKSYKKSLYYYKKSLHILPIEKWPISLIGTLSILIVNIGFNYIKLGQKRNAYKWYTEVLNKYTINKSDLKIIYNNLGVITQKVLWLEKAINLDRNYINPYIGLVAIYKNKSQAAKDNNFYYIRQLVCLYKKLLSIDRSNKIKYEKDICTLCCKLLELDSTQKMWILKNVNSHLNPISEENINKLDTSDIKYLFNFVEDTLQFLSQHLRIQLLKGYLFQYTKLSTLKSICNVNKNNDWDKEHPFKLRLYNSSYMNDPLEGKELLKKLSCMDKEMNNGDTKDYVKSIINAAYNKAQSNELTSGHVYIASLSYANPTQSNSMPLWNSYSDEHKGIVMGLDIHTYNHLNKTNADIASNSSLSYQHFNRIPLNLYKVAYNKKNKNTNDVRCLQDLVTNMSNFPKEIFKDRHVLDLIKLHLDRIRFLFKPAAFEYEKEYRIMEEESDFTKTKFDRGDSRLYVELDPKHSNVTAKLAEIVFGSRCESYYWVPIVNKQLGNVKMYKSNIKYR